MPKVLLTDEFIEKIPQVSDQRVDYFDTIVPAFHLRVFRHAKSFRLVYRIDGKQRPVTLGRWPQLSLSNARAQAKELRKQVQNKKSIELHKVRNNDSNGYIYVIDRPGIYLKIGHSRDPKCRPPGLQTGSPEKLTLSLIVPARNAARVDNLIQKFLAPFKANLGGGGEWYKKCPEVYAFIEFLDQVLGNQYEPAKQENAMQPEQYRLMIPGS